MESKVSRRLKQPLSEVVIQNIFAPRLKWEFAQNFDLLNQVNFAHLLMLENRKILDSNSCIQLAQALLKIQEDGSAAVELDAAREEAYFNYEAHLIKLVGPELGGRLHTARSRNDMRATFDRIRAREYALRISESLTELKSAALDQASDYAEFVMPGFTHMQPAQPISFGYYLSALVDAWIRDHERLLHVLQSADGCPLGACALAGTSFPIDRFATSESLGFTHPLGNALDAVASRDFLLELISTISIMATNFGRMAQDFYIWSSSDYGLVSFPDSVASTSSIMPQKKNPVVLEYIRGKTGHLIGLTTSALSTMKSTHFTHAGDTGREVSRVAWESCEEALRLIELAKLLVSTVEPNRERMLKRACDDFSTVTDLADLLVRDCDMSFREAHHVIGTVVRGALDRNLSARQITPAMISSAALELHGRQLEISPEEVIACLNPILNFQSRATYGGPAPAVVRKHINEQAEVLSRITGIVGDISKRVSAEHTRLEQRIRDLANT